MAGILSRLLPPKRPRTAKPLPPPTTSKGIDSSDLAVRRDWLSRQYAEMQWDLGGVTYEMAIRDHFRLDVLVRHAARLQEIDAELAEVERMLRLEEAGAAGACSSCGALYARGAVFCWQCGHDLMGREQVEPEPTRVNPATATDVHVAPGAPAEAAGTAPADPALHPVPGPATAP